MGVVQFHKRTIRYLGVFFLGVLLYGVVQSSSVQAAPADISLTADQDTIRIEWIETSADPVDDYTVEVSTDGGGTWTPWPHSPSPQTYVDLPRAISYNVSPITFHIRITTEFSDSSSSLPITAVLTVPPYWNYSKSTFFTAHDPITTVSDSYRKSLGLDYWVDGNIGFFERGGEVISISSNGPVMARTIKGSGGQLLGTLTDNSVSVQNQAISSNYAAGGPVYYDEPNDRLLLFYHGEIHDPDDSLFYGYIGMAASIDGGETFEDLGQIIRPNIDINDPDRTNPTEVGGAPYIIKDGYFYVYFKDMLEDGSVVNVAVARASVDDVLSAAAAGTTATWQKYAGGSFSVSGIGGAPDNIFAGEATAVWFDTAYIQSIGKYVMVFSNSYSAPSTHLIATSEDGINWGNIELLYEEASPNEMAYLTISSPDFSNQRVITGDEFYLFRTVSSTAYGGFRWDNAWQEVLTVSFPVESVGGDGGVVGGDSGGGSGTLAATGNDVFTLSLLSSITVLITFIGVLRFRVHRL